MEKLITILLIIIFFLVPPCFAELQLLIKVPATEKIKKKDYTLSDKVRDKFKEKRCEVTDDLLWNTRVYKDFKLINFVTQMTLSELDQYIKDENLKWTILAATERVIEDKKLITRNLLGYDPDEVINFIKRVRVYEDSNFVREENPVNIEYGGFAGLPKMKTKQQIIDALKDVE